MKSFIRSAVSLFASFTFIFAAVPDDVRGSLDKLVPEIIRLLEAKEYATVLETLVLPEDFKKITDTTPLAEFAKEFGMEKAGQLIEILKSLKDKKPKLSEDGNTATFELLENPVNGKNKLAFTKIEGFWFMNN